MIFRSHGGTTFSSSDDLSTGIQVTLDNPEKEDDPIREAMAADVAEFIAWHALQVLPTLNGFTGYDALRFHFRNTP